MNHSVVLALPFLEIGRLGIHHYPLRLVCPNKLIQGSQCTIIWHIDDLKISHTDSTAVDEVIDLLCNEFRQEGPLTVT